VDGNQTSRFTAVVALAAILGSGFAVVTAVAQQPPATEGSAPAPDAPREETSPQLPPGHPAVINPATPGELIPLPPPGSGSGASGLRWQVPEGWIEEPPASAMRRAQYRLPGAGGEGQCVVYYFGPGQGGDAADNAQRWASQFTQPDGGPATAALATEWVEVEGIPVLLVEVTGTFYGGMTMTGGPQQSYPDYMLLGAIAQGPDANWFFKLTGPEATLREQKPAFEKLYRSLRRGE